MTRSTAARPDLLIGGDGKDFVNGGANSNETFAGEDDDFVIAGEGLDSVFGGGGNDWAEGGDGPDLLIGDSSNLFFLDDSQRPGHDVLVGQGGDDDYDMEGGDDVGIAGPGVKKMTRASGYDWEIGVYDPQPQDADLDLPIAPLDILQVGVRDRCQRSGSPLRWRPQRRTPWRRPDPRKPWAAAASLAVMSSSTSPAWTVSPGLRPARTILAHPRGGDHGQLSESKECPALNGPMVWGEGNILLGGGGNDVLEGRGGNDILDGDSFLNVRLSVRTDPNNPASEIGSATSMNAPYQRNSAGELVGNSLQQAVFTGAVDPGNVIIVREILTSAEGTDTAVFSDVESSYTITTTGGDGTMGSPGSVTTVLHNNGEDGTDTLHNIEHLIFGSGTNDGDDDGQAAEENAEDGQAGEDNKENREVITGASKSSPGMARSRWLPHPRRVARARGRAGTGTARTRGSPDPGPGGFAIRIVDPAGAQVGEIVNTELGGPRTVVRGFGQRDRLPRPSCTYHRRQRTFVFRLRRDRNPPLP